jgi:hypothetical protein
MKVYEVTYKLVVEAETPEEARLAAVELLGDPDITPVIEELPQ